jgi:hypothetical protein
MRAVLLAGIAALVLCAASPSQATEDFCIEVGKTRDGFLALREGPGTQFKMLAKLKPGFPLDADTWGMASKWTRVWIATGRHAFVYSKYTKQRECPEDRPK